MIHSFSLYQICSRNAYLFANNPAFIWDEGVVNYREFFKEVRQLASGMRAAGFTKGVRFVILSKNTYYFFSLIVASSILGSLVVPMNWRLTSEEIDNIIKDCEPTFLAVDKEFEEKGKEILRKNSFIKDIIYLSPPEAKGISYYDLLASKSVLKEEEVCCDDDLFIIYTIVNGEPRGAVLTQKNLIFSAIQTLTILHLNEKDGYLNLLPLFHIMGLNISFSILYAGGKNVILPFFEVERSLQLIEEHGLSILGSFPPILSKLLDGMASGNFNINSLKYVLGVEQSQIIQQWEQKTNSTFWTLYGQTETTGYITLSPFKECPGSAGRVGPLMEMKIFDDNDNELPFGEKGEIVVRGPLVFKGYWRQEGLTKHMFRNGWHHTGDLGCLDDRGYLSFLGRKPEKEIIKSGGENVSPFEVEEVILTHPAVKEVVVIGVPDPEFGEGIKAICVLEKGKQLTKEKLQKFVASKIASYKKPRYVQFVESLPKKGDRIDREGVKQQYGKEG